MSTKNPFDPAAMSDSVKEQSQQIWLAGLGAFAKAQENGAKAYEKLVSDGLTMQQKVHATAEEKLAEATQKVSGQWGKLENIFEDRVAKALTRLGIPSASELSALHARVEHLEKQLGASPKSAAKPKAAAKAAAKSAPAKKAAAKRTAAK